MENFMFNPELWKKQENEGGVNPSAISQYNYQPEQNMGNNSANALASGPEVCSSQQYVSTNITPVFNPYVSPKSVNGMMYGGGISPQNAYVANAPQGLSEAAEKNAMELHKYYEKKCIDIRTSACKEQMKTEAAINRAQAMEDIKKIAKMRTITVNIADSGLVTLINSLFSGNRMFTINLFIKEKVLYETDCMPGQQILYIEFLQESKVPLSIAIKTEEMKKSVILQKFKATGISLGFSDRVERRVMEALCVEAKRKAEHKNIPYRHGWYRREGRWEYAFPETITWKELSER